MTALYVYFRDELGNVRCEVDGTLGLSGSVDFCGGFCYFQSGGKDFKIPVSALVAIMHEPN